jgi:hypothetical protein
MKQPPSRIVDYRRLARRNLPSLLSFKFLNEYGYDKGPVVVQAIVADICETIRRYYRRKGDLEPGQLIYLAPAKSERAGRGKTIAKTRLVPVVLTIVAQEDIEAVKEGADTARRREIRVRRLCREAFEQGGLLSQRDIAIVTGYSTGAVSMTAVQLRKRGEFLPLRGYICDMGNWPTHKAAIIRLYLQGMLTPDISRRTFHTKESVDRYIRGFDRVRLLAAKFSRDELPLLASMSPRLVDEYLKLIDEHDALPEEVSAGAVASS